MLQPALIMHLTVVSVTNLRWRVDQVLFSEGTEMAGVHKGMFGLLGDGEELFVGFILDWVAFEVAAVLDWLLLY